LGFIFGSINSSTSKFQGMNRLLFTLWWKKSIRSVAFSRSLIWSVVVAFFILYIFANLLLIAFGLPFILEENVKSGTPISFLNSKLIYFFLIEFIYRFFIQRMPILEMEHYLHLPIRRSQLINYLLIRSFISPLSLIVLILFLPFSIITIGGWAGVIWLMTIFTMSMVLHAMMLWFKQKFGDAVVGIFGIALLSFASFGAAYYGYYEIGILVAPFFEYATQSFIPALVSLIALAAFYYNALTYYKKNSYIESLSSGRKFQFRNNSLGILSRFGLAGEMANAEWKLIMRHKKSRNYFFISLLFLLYGIMFYDDPAINRGGPVNGFRVFAGIFLTGSFLIQYGQLFLSWNSSFFDFYMNRKYGVKALLEGKFILLSFISFVILLLTVPYIYYGWEILLINIVCLIFNLGITIHIFIYFTLWKPKPMDLTKGALFNYEGVGLAQFLLIIPLMIVPLIVYLPFSILMNAYAGLGALALVGVTGLIFRDTLLNISVNKIQKNKYDIASSFRQEL